MLEHELLICSVQTQKGLGVSWAGPNTKIQTTQVDDYKAICVQPTELNNIEVTSKKNDIMLIQLESTWVQVLSNIRFGSHIVVLLFLSASSGWVIIFYRKSWALCWPAWTSYSIEWVFHSNWVFKTNIHCCHSLEYWRN